MYKKIVQIIESMFLLPFLLLWPAQRENFHLLRSETQFPMSFQCKIDHFLCIALASRVQNFKPYVQFSENCTYICTKKNTGPNRKPTNPNELGVNLLLTKLVVSFVTDHFLETNSSNHVPNSVHWIILELALYS